MKTLTVYDGGASVEVQSAAPAWTPNAAFANLAPNKFIDLGPLTLTIPNGESLTQVRQVYSFSGCSYDPKRGRIYAFGGGHACTNYNSVYGLDLSSLASFEEYPPTPAVPDLSWANYETRPTKSSTGALLPGVGRACVLRDISGVGGPYPRPTARHTEDQIEVVGDELILFNECEGNGRGTQAEIDLGTNPDGYDLTHIFYCYGQVAHYSLVDKTWQFENANPTQTDGDGVTPRAGSTEYDPVSGLVFWLNNYDFSTYDPKTRIKTHRMSVLGSSQLVNEAGAKVANTLGYNSTLTYRTVDQKMYWIDRLVGQVWRMECDRTNWGATKLVSLTMTGTPPPYTGEHPVRYDSVNDVFLTGPFSNVMYAFDCKTQAWSSQTITGGDLGSMAPSSHMAIYAPDVNAYIFLTDQNNVNYRSRWLAYRYK